MSEYLAMWKNYFNFQGRTSVRGYWMAFLFNMLAAFILVFVSILLSNLSAAFMFLPYIYYLAVIIPSIALVVRRLHDINRTGWWYFIGLVPCVGVILLIVWFCTGSVDAGNRFGSEQV